MILNENRCVVRDSLNEIKIYAKNKEIYDGDIFLWVSSRYTLDCISGPQKVLSETTLETNFALKSSKISLYTETTIRSAWGLLENK